MTRSLRSSSISQLRRNKCKLQSWILVKFRNILMYSNECCSGVNVAFINLIVWCQENVVDSAVDTGNTRSGDMGYPALDLICQQSEECGVGVRSHGVMCLAEDVTLTWTGHIPGHMSSYLCHLQYLTWAGQCLTSPTQCGKYDKF